MRYKVLWGIVTIEIVFLIILSLLVVNGITWQQAYSIFYQPPYSCTVVLVEVEKLYYTDSYYQSGIFEPGQYQNMPCDRNKYEIAVKWEVELGELSVWDDNISKYITYQPIVSGDFYGTKSELEKVWSKDQITVRIALEHSMGYPRVRYSHVDQQKMKADLLKSTKGKYQLDSLTWVY